MAVEACLNGGRTRAEHPGVPLAPAELAADAVAVQAAGAFAVHLHPRGRGGLPTLDAKECDAAVSAIRAAAPRLPIGLSTSAAIDPDPFARAAAMTAWRHRPDFVSVNVNELGWMGVARAALHAGIAIEAGLAVPADAEALRGSSFAHQILRVVVAVDGGADGAQAIAELTPEGVPQLWHGKGDRTWEVISAAGAAGIDVRVGLEDVLVLPDGRTAADNAELVAAASALVGDGRPHPF
ncbi:MAG TPA: 3-keto-5-aminohexanoate cleavage protein [Solirubrobacteraceae bacterium]